MTLSDGILLQWNMQHLTPAGLMQDFSGNALHGTLVLNPTDIPQGFQHRARRFTGLASVNVNSVVLDITDPNCSLAFACQGDVTVGASGFGPGKAGSYKVARLIDDTFRARFQDGLGGITDAITGVKDTQSWFHVVGICRAGLSEIYVNGVLEAQDLVGPIAALGPQPGQNFVIGEVGGDVIGDEIIFWNRALAATEVLELFNSYFATARATMTTQVGLQS